MTRTTQVAKKLHVSSQFRALKWREKKDGRHPTTYHGHSWTLIPTLSKSDFSTKLSDEHFKSTVSSKLLLYFIVYIDTLQLHHERTDGSQKPNPPPMCQESVVDENPESTKTTFSVSFSCTSGNHPTWDFCSSRGTTLVPKRNAVKTRSPRVFKTRGAISR